MPPSDGSAESPTKEKPRTLDELIQSLPRELYDEIFDYTLTCNDFEIEIDKDYKPPVQLQIDSHSREKYARTYYSEKTFMIRTKARRDEETLKIGARWLLSLPLIHKAQVKDIRISSDRENIGPDSKRFVTRNYNHWVFSNLSEGDLSWSGPSGPGDANVRVNRWCQDERGEWEETWITWLEMWELRRKKRLF